MKTARVKTEVGKPISFPYLNDLEHNLRHPPRGHLIEELAKHLKLDADLLYFLAGKLPSVLFPTRLPRSRCWPPTVLFARN